MCWSRIYPFLQTQKRAPAPSGGTSHSNR
jgi:hypothetical protein